MRSILEAARSVSGCLIERATTGVLGDFGQSVSELGTAGRLHGLLAAAGVVGGSVTERNVDAGAGSAAEGGPQAGLVVAVVLNRGWPSRAAAEVEDDSAA